MPPARLVRDESTGAYSFAEPEKAVINQVTGQTAEGLTPSNQIQPTIISSGQGKDIVQKEIKPLAEEARVASDKAEENRKAYQTSQGNQLLTERQARAMGLTSENTTETTGSVPTPESERKFALGEADQQYLNSLDQLNLANIARYKSQISTLKSQWDSARAAQEEANRFTESVTTLGGLRSGQARYAPEINADMLTDVKTRGLQKLAKMDADYAASIGELESAIESSNWRAAGEKAAYISEVRAAFEKEVQDQVKTAQKIAEEANKKTLQVTRDSAISSLLKQGVTDPNELLDYLNFDESGAQVGDFTAEEIKATLDRLTPKDSADGRLKFSSTDTAKLIGSGLNVAEIQAIQDDLNKYGWDKTMSGLTGTQRTTIEQILNGKPVGGIGGQLTISEAKSLGLPIAMVGKSQEQVIADLSSVSPPEWFIEYLENQRQQNLLPEVVQPEWEKFRSDIESAFQSGSSAGFDLSDLPPPVE